MPFAFLAAVPSRPSATHPQLLDHRAHRPRQVDARRPLHPALRRARRPRDERAGARLDGPRARARASRSRRRPPRSRYEARDGSIYNLNLIDTPGHVDFAYEVSRSLAACEGALLVVDASQGVEAQTVANCYTATEQGVEVVPVLNKIDLPSAEPDRVIEEIEDIVGIPAHDAILASAKTGEGIDDILEAVIARIPPPKGDAGRAAAGAGHRRVVRQLRRRRHARARRERHAEAARQDPPDGDRRRARLRAGRRVHAEGASRASSSRPARSASSSPASRSSPTRRSATRSRTRQGRAPSRLPGFKEVKPQVFAGLYPVESNQYEALRNALDEAQAQRRVAALRARGLAGARLRLPLRLPRPAAHGHRAGAARARVRHGPDHDGADGHLPGAAARRHGRRRSRTRRSCPTCRASRRSASRSSA